MFREYIRRGSSSLGREMEFLWFGQFGRPVLLFPTSSGRFYESEDMGLTASLADKVDAGEIQLILVDSVNDESWNNKSVHPSVRIARHVQYDAYLRDELVPYIFNRAQRGDLVVYGASLGAYHAANFAARYPDLVSRAICFSGIYTTDSLIDGYSDDNGYFNNPMAFIAGMDGEWVTKLSRVSWVIAAGEYDTLAQQNRDFSNLLLSKGIPHHAEIWSGVSGHDWPSWRENLRRFV